MTTETIEVTADDGAIAVVAHHGAQVLGWRCAHDPVERLYLSPKAVFTAGGSIRGGIPICFPQFASRGPLPKHGFARNRLWRLEERGVRDDGTGTARWRLVGDAETLRLWPHAFAATLGVAVRGDMLQVALEIVNVDRAAFSFTGALHSYLAIPDIGRACVAGLEGLAFCDSADGGRLKVGHAGAVTFTGEVDRIYGAVDRVLEVTAPGMHLRVASEGFKDVVVWNPGAVVGATIGDLPSGGYRHFVCVEAGVILTPVSLEPGTTWRGSQTITLVRTAGA
jgi:glucose-6-phosphate 1-epimerase